MKRNMVLFVLLLTFLVPVKVFALALTGRVVEVKDGDTVVIIPDRGGRFFRCNLYGIDAPEIPKGAREGQPYGIEAAIELKQLVSGKRVEVIFRGPKTCVLKEGNTDFNLEMVGRGYAWSHRQGLYLSEYIVAESEARFKRLGLWAQINPQPPWEYRRMIKGNKLPVKKTRRTW